ncbi:hypothetical protein EV385_0485 [Krasilnikovia cinnamomea]|uniref:Uncharacterized protein n=1 Tax=Krasilnikovia cinnamomea TaxID=349313 RepID=A0A4Q7ZES1_9ACTN|nr:hypothetical protein [Krasilnikovia cinnamomea]RZU48761.1 hypothetical protein EV385_0485 [Krasilnikovia cinnamomea]
MHTISDVGGPSGIPARHDGARLVAAVDVEWSKNYRIKNGNRPFCYSIVWITLPAPGTPPPPAAELPLACTSLYLDHEHERGNLISAAAADLTAALHTADLLIGHQLGSDLAVLHAHADTTTSTPLAAARQAWHTRRTPAGRVLDTRFDAGHLLTGRSRRLVDVCGELALDVTQPELARHSMTALHRRWMISCDTEARERITALNLRHSLSTALVGLHAAGLANCHHVNVNALLARHLSGRLGWLDHPTFRALLPATTATA